MKTTFVVLLLATVCLLTGNQNLSAETHEQTGPAKATAATEIVVIATQHFLTDMPPGYTPGHLRALLEKFSPDILAVEAPVGATNWQEYAPNELREIVQPWAGKKKIEVVPVDWLIAPNEPPASFGAAYEARMNAMMQKIQSLGKGEALQANETRAMTQLAPLQSCEQMNSETYYATLRDYNAELHKLYGQNTPWEERNAHIVSNIVALCQSHPGRKIAVLFGGMHSYYLADHLASQSGVKVVPAATFFPLTNQEITRNTLDTDYLKALRLLNFMPGSLAPQAVTDLGKKVEKLKDFPALTNDYLAFRARALLHEKRSDEALGILKPLAALSPNVISGFDGKTPIRDMALLLTILAEDQKGQKGKALKDLKALAENTDVTSEIRQTAQMMLQGRQSKR